MVVSMPLIRINKDAHVYGGRDTPGLRLRVFESLRRPFSMKAATLSKTTQQTSRIELIGPNGTLRRRYCMSVSGIL
jgi:hypothetical protein